ncbi:MAG: DUF1906 domain-containing protein [Candidatus Babeliales bacterium]|nr:DUF1906 domain-containing protein [Candidatus Babeliales bacterium]
MQPLNGKIESAPDKATGCDCNFVVTPKLAQAFINHGYSFVIRYIPRAAGSNSGGDLTNAEANTIINAGLGLMAVQHVSNDNWHPTAELGTAYGNYAASYAKQIGLAAGVNIWVDLEMVNINSAKQDVIAYCKAWYAAISAAGYVPGIYIGYQVIIDNQDAYNLPFAHYWAAYNTDTIPAVRGYQMVQGIQVNVGGIDVDPNTVKVDHKGGTPLWLIKK